MVAESTQKELSFVKGGGHPVLNSGQNKCRLFGLPCIRPIVRSMSGLVNQSPKFPKFCLKRPFFTIRKASLLAGEREKRLGRIGNPEWLVRGESTDPRSAVEGKTLCPCS